MIQPRPYQLDAVDAVFRDWSEENSSLVTMPTGTGKTVLFAAVIRRWLEENPFKRAVVVAHREELIFQARDELAPILGFTPEIEMGDYQAVVNPLYGEPARCVVASVASLCRDNRLRRYDSELYGLLVVDEAHHCVPSCSTYWKLCQHFTGHRLGVTATPRRGDGLAMGQAFQRASYVYEIADAIRDGYLVDVQQQYVTVQSLDISRVRTTAGELNESDLSESVRIDRTLAEMGTAIIDHCGEEPTLVFTVDVAHGEDLAAFLNSMKPGSAVTLSGKTPADERRRQLRRFEGGEFQYLLGCALFTEGFNCPRISRVVMAKLTKSIVYYTQAIGRGTRPLRGVLTPEMTTAEERRAAILASAKPFVRVLDFVGNSGRHSLIRCVDVLGGDVKLAKAAERKKQDGEKGGEPESVLDSLERAKAAMEREEREKIRQAEIQARATYGVRDVNPFGENADGVSDRKRKKDDRAPAGPRMKHRLEQHGLWREGMRHGEAVMLSNDIDRRRKHDLCTVKMSRSLERYGFDGDMPFQAGKAMLDLIEKRGWQAPNYELSRDRLAMHCGADGQYRLVIHDPDYGRVVVGKGFQSPEDCRAAYVGSLIPKSA